MIFSRESVIKESVKYFNSFLEKFGISDHVDYSCIENTLCIGLDVFKETDEKREKIGYKLEICLPSRLQDDEAKELEKALGEKYKNCFFEFDKVEFDADIIKYVNMEDKKEYVEKRALEASQALLMINDISRKYNYSNKISAYKEEDIKNAKYLMVYGNDKKEIEETVRNILKDKKVYSSITKGVEKEKSRFGFVKNFFNRSKGRFIKHLEFWENEAEDVQRLYEFGELPGEKTRIPEAVLRLRDEMGKSDRN